jgi:predicted RNA-binding protein YlxR (DUF448 family)
MRHPAPDLPVTSLGAGVPEVEPVVSVTPSGRLRPSSPGPANRRWRPERRPVRCWGRDAIDSPVVVRELIPPARTKIDPVRTCIGCRERAARSELLRVVAGTDAHGREAVVPDPGKTAPGRGAHLHPTTVCYDLAVRRRAFSRSLRARDGLASERVGDYLDSSNRP